MGNFTTPSGVGYVSSHNYIDSQSIAYSQSIKKPEVDGVLVRPFGNQMISGWLESMGSYKGTQSLDYFHSEEDRIREIVKGTCTAGAAGAGVAFTIAGAYQKSISLDNSPYVYNSTETAYPVRQGDILLFPDGVQGRVSTDVTAGVFTVVPSKSTESIPTVTASEEVVVLSNLATEFQDSRTPWNTTTWSYKNQLSHHYDTAKASVTAMSEITWFTNLGKSESDAKWYLENNRNVYANVITHCEQFMVVGDELTNSNATFNEVTATRGLIPDIEAYGNVETYTAGSFSLTDLENMGLNLVQNKGSRENTLWVGYALKIELDKLFRTTDGLNNGGVIYSMADGSSFGEERRVAFEFDHVSYGGFRYFIKRLDMFNDPQGLGAAGQTYTNMGVLIPSDDMVPEQFQGDSSIGARSISLRYLEAPYYNMGYREWPSGGGLERPTNAKTEVEFTFDVYRGLECRGLSRFGLFSV